MTYFMDGRTGLKLGELSTAQKTHVHIIYHLSGFSLLVTVKNPNKWYLSFLQRIMLFTFASNSSKLTDRFGKFSAVELT